MGERRINLILNPAANRQKSGARREGIAAFLEGHGFETAWHVTDGPEHAGVITESLPEDEVAVAVGGDGTVHEVAAACAGTDRVMGVLPTGSGNDYVKALGVGTDLRRALDVLVRGSVRRVDAGEVGGTRFNNGLGIGFDAQVAAGVADAPAYLGGFGGYLWSAAKLLIGLRCYGASLRLDGARVVRSKTILVAVALGTTFGARFQLAPDARLDDGLFDIIWSEEVSRTEVLKLLPSAFDGTLLKHPKVHVARAREVEVELSEDLPAHVDGELLTPAKSFRAKVLPGALRVIAP